MKLVLKALVVIVVCLALVFGLAYLVGDSESQVAGWPLLVVLAAIAMGVQWLVFIPSYIYQTEHYYDLTGSLTYLVVVGLAVLLAGGALDARGLLVAGLVSCWALRLGIFLFRRVKKAGKDGRFDVIKTRWSRFLVTWTLQGAWVFITLLAALVAITSTRQAPLGLLAYIGLLMWLAGFCIESIADYQKSAFNGKPENQGRFVNVGLWRWSRHPNYFGEILLWMGIAVIAVPVFEGLQWLALISPVFVVFLLVKVSGIPLLEKRAEQKWGDSLDYHVYKKETPLLLLRPPRK